MSKNIEIITQIVPKNNANFAVADVNDLKGGYIQVDTNAEMQEFLKYSNRLKTGMLCFVINEKSFYQYLNGKWSIWQVKSGASLELQSVDSMNDLYGSSLETRGQVVYVGDLNALRWYDGTTWQSFSKIYIQDTEPDDLNGVWLDTSEDSEINKPESTTTQLLKMINVLARRISILEYRNQQLQSGTFDNNMYNLYDEIQGIDPGTDINSNVDEEDADGTTEEEEMSEAEMLANTLLADSEEPTTYKDTLPNVKHIQIKYGTYSDMQKYKNNFLPAELLYCYNTRELWIKDPKTYQLIKIGATGGSSDDNPDEEDIMNGIIQNGDYIGSISFVDMVNNDKHYTFSVRNGDLDLECQEDLTEPITNTQTASYTSDDIQYYKKTYLPAEKTTSGGKASMLWINSVYAAGGYSKYNPCNYGFVELANLNQSDINLNGFYLHYSEGTSTSNRKWISLPLRGTIKAQSTYLIKCARTGDDKFARIKVDTPDTYFSKDLAYNPNIFEDTANNYSVWDEDGMLILNTTCVFFVSGPCYPTTDSAKFTNSEYTANQLSQSAYTCQSPWLNDPVNGIGVVYGFCDLVGFGSGMPSVLPDSTKAMGSMNANNVYVAYYSLDNVSQAWKGTMLDSANSGWSTGKIWTYVNLITPNQAIDVSKYSPKNSKEGKNIFYNKHLLPDDKPAFVTCSFGFNAHTTRCFAWISKGYRDEYIQFRKQGETDWYTFESIKDSECDNLGNYYQYRGNKYNRIRGITTDGTYFTAHKYILDAYDKYNISKGKFYYTKVTDKDILSELESGEISSTIYDKWFIPSGSSYPSYICVDGTYYKMVCIGPLNDGPTEDETYEYRVGWEDHWTDIKTFTLRNRQSVINDGFSFVQVTDQQGFNQEEYEEWRLLAESINMDMQYNLIDIQFTVNTGDATQNGNRINEWIDYFNGGKSLFNSLEQEYTVGNNDLCPEIPYELGTGADTTKVNPVNVNYFFAYDYPFAAPISANGNLIPSTYSFVYGNTYFLCMNSELTDSNASSDGTTNYGSCYNLFGEQSALTQQRLKEWAEQDLAMLAASTTSNIEWKVAYCHESPFTILIQSVLADYQTKKTADSTYTASNRGDVTSHLNNPGGWWFSKFLEDNAFNLCMCGHKHTYSTSRYLHDNPNDRMQPYVYDENGSDATFINDDNKLFMNVTNSKEMNYVKYTMCQASGYKLTSNKELPGRNIGWLEQYYPGNAVSGDSSSVTVNTNQRYPHYIIWTIGKGKETEDPSTTTDERQRILGQVYKIQSKTYSGNNKMFNYNTRPFDVWDVEVIGGNGTTNNGKNNIIVEKLGTSQTT